MSNQGFAPEAEPLQEIPLPSSLHPSWIKPAQVENVTGMGWARQFFEQASGAWEKLNKLRTTARPEMTRKAHQMEVNKAFDKATKQVTGAYDQARERLKQSREAYRVELEQAAGLNQPGPHDAEIRSVLRSMSERDRHQAILDAVERGDSDEIRAAVTAPALTVGMDPDKLANVRAAWERKAAPGIVQSIEQIDKAERQLTAGIDAWVDDGAKLAYADELKATHDAQAQAEEIAGNFETA